MNNETSQATSVLVMGVGRSGTTAIYGLIQDILENNFPGNVDYVYEPFLWDRSTFNKLYCELTDEFRHAASISVEGIYHHKLMPMLMDEKSEVHQSSMDWLSSTLTPGRLEQHYLGKMIRANGRLSLIRKTAPNIKIVFVIRNPIDVLNSAAQLFSFYGDEFFESDFERFAKEVANQFGRTIKSTGSELDSLKAEYLYWYFSNLSFLEYARHHPQRILSFAYEALVHDRPSIVHRLCDFLEVDYEESYTTGSRENVGDVRHGYSALSRKEFDYLRDKLSAYDELLEFVDLRPKPPIADLIKTITWNEDERMHSILPRYNAYYGGRELQRLNSKLGELEHDLSQASELLANLHASKRLRIVNWILSPLDKWRKWRNASDRV